MFEAIYKLGVFLILVVRK